MDLSRPLAVITPTLDAVVLQALAATTGWASGAQVHRSGRAGSPDGVRKVLERLVGQGIVLEDHHAHATLFALNREHVAAEAIVSVAMARARVVERIVGAVEAGTISWLHASLFGSFARGEATADSDIDVLFVRDSADGVLNDDREAFVDGLSQSIRRWTGNRAQIVDLDLGALAEMVVEKDPLVDSWCADQVHLSGMRLPELLRSVT